MFRQRTHGVRIICKDCHRELTVYEFVHCGGWCKDCRTKRYGDLFANVDDEGQAQCHADE